MDPVFVTVRLRLVAPHDQRASREDVYAAVEQLCAHPGQFEVPTDDGDVEVWTVDEAEVIDA